MTGDRAMAIRTPLIRFLRVLLTMLVVLAGAIVALYLLLLGWGWLMRISWVSDWTRQSSKRGNRYLRKFAGTRLGMLYFNLSALHHVGRRSGRPYVTPLSAYPLGDGFVLSVAYPKVDWCENVLAAGKCTLTWNGKEYALGNPEVIPEAQAMKAYPLLVKPFLAAQAPGTKKFIWLHRAKSDEGQPADARAAEHS
jgi:deazaflavin-dependent oxidoreductase (nitroreductase family)